jgi:predicted transcriptional regulator of viral defense system
MATNEEKALKLVQVAGVLRSRELVAAGIPRTVLSRLERQGKIRRVGRGLYTASDAVATEHVNLMEVCKRSPQGTICLISALNFHEMTMQMPHEVWLAIGNRTHKPKIEYPPVRIVRFSQAALDFGVETHVIQGVVVRVTTPAKTVADCFKYRSKVGTDVAIEALKVFRRGRKGKLDDLWQAAEVCRVTNVMRPYLEAIV